MRTVLHLLTIWAFKHHAANEPVPQRFQELIYLLNEP